MKKMENFIDSLHNCRLFSSIDTTHISAMLGCLGAERKSVKKGISIFSCGDKADKFGIVLSGKVQIVRFDYYGNRSIVTEIVPSHLFGEVYACSGASVIPVDIVAEEDCEVLLINAGRIINTCTSACEFHHRVIFNLLKIVADRSLVLGQKINIVSRRTTREKLLAYLDTVAKQTGKSTFTIPYNRQALADYLDVDRSGLSAEISKLCRENLIKCSRSEFTLLHNPVNN